jgi:ectoine hydroxylase-related dioxygenase (phytanoyl-CoA dioxygenase family)
MSFETDGFLQVAHALTANATAVLRATCLRLRKDEERAPHTSSSDDWRDQFDLPSDEWQAACDEARWQADNIVARERTFLDLIDHPRMLPLVAELLSDNIFLMSSRAMIRGQVPMSQAEFEKFPLDWHRDLGTSAVELAEPLPRLSVKIAYWLTALDAPGQGAMQVVPGSHRLNGAPSINPRTGRPYGAIEIHAEPGDALLFDQRLWHAAAPNITTSPRICLFYAYGFRWLRPDDYETAPEALLNDLPAERRQLLGAAASRSGYYLPTSADLPLHDWLKAGGHG